MPELVRLEHYGFTYPQQTRPALSDVELTIRDGEFWVLCGTSGCGKTTLLRQLKPSLRPHGAVQGCVWFDGQPLEQLPPRRQAADIGFVLQSPEEQTVTDKVWHELAFGLESLGYDTPAIRRRVAEMASFFGIQDWFHRRVDELSGGQKQLLALASVMVMQPRLLILDEPTSQLDPIAAADFLQTVGRLNRELGVTVLLTEHRLEEALPLATHAAVLDGGRLLCAGAPEEVCRALRGQGHDMFLAMPAAVRIWASVDADASCPITVREGRDFLTDWCGSHPLRPLPPEPAYPAGEPVLTGEGLWFRYDGQAEDVVRGLDIQLRRGELLALLGGNGAGKSTTLGLLSGALMPQRGAVSHTGRLGVLPQDPRCLFVKNTVRQDLYESFDGTAADSDRRGTGGHCGMCGTGRGAAQAGSGDRCRGCGRLDAFLRAVTIHGAVSCGEYFPDFGCCGGSVPLGCSAAPLSCDRVSDLRAVPADSRCGGVLDYLLCDLESVAGGSAQRLHRSFCDSRHCACRCCRFRIAESPPLRARGYCAACNDF